MKRGDVRSGQVPAALGGEALESVLCVMFELDVERAGELLAAGAVFVDRKRMSRTVKVRAGQSLSVDVGFEAPRIPDLRRSVLFVDRDMIVMDKTAGMPSVPTLTAAAGTLMHGIESQGLCDFSPLEVHRLDAATSGVIVYARRGPAHSALASQFAEGKVDKRYLARVHGTLEAVDGRVDAALGRDGRNSRKWCVCPEGTPGARASVTEFHVLVFQKGYADLEVRPRTGRTHQIRVHMCHLGLPIWGDHSYGDADLDRPFRPTRLWLHAAQLTIAHPGTRKPMTFRAPVPSTMPGFGESETQENGAA